MRVGVSEQAARAYQCGHYEEALELLRRQVESDPDAIQHLYSLIWLCERVVATVPDEDDADHLAALRELEQASGLRRLRLRLKGRQPGAYVRCKWCGHFTPYRDPNVEEDNFCLRCGAKYPAPDAYWDSPTGMAYSRGRSWEDNPVNLRVWKELMTRVQTQKAGAERRQL